jgi:cytochrome c-type biogenesis protein CcmH/NrfF
MTRWLALVGIGLALAVTAAVGVLALQPREVSAAERVERLAAELRCPDCQGLSVADSPTGSAREIRRPIDELVAAGASDDEVRAHFVARYGEWILLAPSSPAIWVVPFAVLAAAIVALLAWLQRPRADAVTPMPTLAAGDARRRAAVREEAEALDA